MAIIDSMEDAFQLILSLGGYCQVAYQIEQRFGFRINSPFDWIVTPIDSIAKILADDGVHFGQSLKPIRNGRAAACHYYEVAYSHEFPRDEERVIRITAEDIISLRNKMLYKYNKFKKSLASNPKTLFLRLAGHLGDLQTTPNIPDLRPTTTEDLNALCAALSQKFPQLIFEIAFVFFSKSTKMDVDSNLLDKRVKIFEMKHDDQDDWQGKVTSWAPVFDSFEFKIAQDIQEVARQYVGDNRDSEILHG